MPDPAVDTIITAGWLEGAAYATTLQVRPESLGQMARPVDLPPPRGPDRLAPPPEEDPEEPAIGKWAAVVLKDDVEAAAQALAPLLALRRAQGYLWGDGLVVMSPSESGTMDSWRRRFERAASPDPPYYVLLVGGADRFPFELQYDLDLDRATGRLDASDSPDGPFSWDACRRYAEKVVAYEGGKIRLTAKPLFYSLSSDGNTRMSHEYLVLELAKKISGGVTALYGSDATVAKLAAALDAQPAPKLVFTASHGVEFPADSGRWGALTDATYLGRATDAVVSAQLIGKAQRFGHGSIIFAFACFSAGVPERSTVSFLTGKSEATIEMGARVAPLPRQLLGHSQGPVAFVGHVDRVSAVVFQSSFGMAGITPYHHFTSWLYRRESPPDSVCGHLGPGSRDHKRGCPAGGISSGLGPGEGCANHG